MTTRCNFPDHTGDPAVFGVCRECNPEPESTQVDLVGALAAAIDRARKARREDFTLAPERPYETILDSDERGGH